ncbi:MAG: glycosyltransferase family 2 protein [Pseudomonadales bacterium]|nr:glycosyltransferase family 2 protein [Pseudomonadales bacterium]
MLSIVVPTYCEADNIPRLAERLNDVLSAEQITYELIISDDNSPDTTNDVVLALSSKLPARLLQPVGRDKDLSLSVIDGIKAAMHDVVVVMDADLSHPPEMVPQMFKALQQNSEAFVVGSRYVPGGSFDRDWSLFRFLNSYVATLITKPLVSCQDPMSGFFGLNRTKIADYDRLNPLGYKIGLELIVRGKFEHIIELPIRFVDREIGESKLDLGQQLKFLRHLRRLYTAKFGTLGEFFSYGLVGASGFIVDLVFYYLLQFLGAPHQIARALSFWPAVSWNWLLNRIATFGDRERRPHGKQWLEFVLASLLGFSINWGVYYVLTTYVSFFDQYRLVALVTGVGVASVFNFVMSSLYVYNEKRK